MKYDPDVHHRRSIRLKGWDYSSPGAYFVTVCTQNRECLLGRIENGEMHFNEIGLLVDENWKKIPQHFKHTQLDMYQIMPNHFHAIITITEKCMTVGAKHSAPDNTYGLKSIDRNASPLQTRPHGTKPGSLSSIMQNFLSITSRKINKYRKTPGTKLWQRNYYEHIIRDEEELNQIREYILYNPLKWELDRENPINWK